MAWLVSPHHAILAGPCRARGPEGPWQKTPEGSVPLSVQEIRRLLCRPLSTARLHTSRFVKSTAVVPRRTLPPKRQCDSTADLVGDVNFVLTTSIGWPIRFEFYKNLEEDKCQRKHRRDRRNRCHGAFRRMPAEKTKSGIACNYHKISEYQGNTPALGRAFLLVGVIMYTHLCLV